jgi:hypothetical protein
MGWRKLHPSFLFVGVYYTKVIACVLLVVYYTKSYNILNINVCVPLGIIYKDIPCEQKTEHMFV